jgi:hypothetical protein
MIRIDLSAIWKMPRIFGKKRELPPFLNSEKKSHVYYGV